ncbi:MAG: hypothetical protein IKH26_00620 [Bacteroidaceae bacterium]|nr:hypothetical protein [Bacteroidaceae bacterium]
MKKKLFSFVTVLMGILLFSSCANDDAVSSDKITDFNANFEKVFGTVNPAQNFNTQRTVTIDAVVENAQGNYTLLVYDARPNTKGASLLGKFENLNPASSTVKVAMSKASEFVYCVAVDGDTRSIASAKVPASGRVTAKFDTAEGAFVDTPTADGTSVTVAFEDLGSTDDFDFNDAVIRVDYVTGTGVANVTLMAVGAVLPLKLYYYGERTQTVALFNGLELHEAMGIDDKAAIINTNWKTKDGIVGVDNVPFVSCQIEVPQDFVIDENGAPFVLEVDGVQGQRQITASTEYGAVPQVFVVGKFYSERLAKTFFWRWPKERVRLNLAFPEVADWMANPEDFSFLANGVEDNLYDGYDPTIDDQVQPGTPEGLEAVDLGLPSGTLWANMNVGAEVPEGYGSYYAWGETEEKDYYDWSTYLYCDGSKETCFDLGTDIAGTEYDVAHVMWGGDWKMPTIDQITELFEYTTNTWTKLNGVKGRLLTGQNGNTIFIPASGCRYQSEYKRVGTCGNYWASTIYPYNGNSRSYEFDFYKPYINWSLNARYFGQTVRPVQ